MEPVDNASPRVQTRRAPIGEVGMPTEAAPRLGFFARLRQRACRPCHGPAYGRGLRDSPIRDLRRSTLEEGWMRRLLCLVLVGLVAVGTLAGTAAAKRDPGPRDARQRMDLVYTNPNNATNSDFAFWGKHAFIGYYTGDAGSPGRYPAPRRRADLRHREPGQPLAGQGLLLRRQPERPDRLGPQRERDRRPAAPCSGPDDGEPGMRSPTSRARRPNGWEGVRVFTISDSPANPFAT